MSLTLDNMALTQVTLKMMVIMIHLKFEFKLTNKPKSSWTTYSSFHSSKIIRKCWNGCKAGKCGAENEFGSQAAANSIQFLFPVTVASFD